MSFVSPAAVSPHPITFSGLLTQQERRQLDAKVAQYESDLTLLVQTDLQKHPDAPILHGKT